MITYTAIIAAVFLLGVFIYLLSYSLWIYRSKNILGAIALIIVALIALILPLYLLISRS